MDKREVTVLNLLRTNPKKFRTLYPMLTSQQARLVALKIRAEARKQEKA